MITTCMSCLTTGGPDKEHGAAVEKLIGRIQEGPKSEEMPAYNMSYQPPRILCAGILPEYWLRDAHVTRKDPESDQIRVKQDDWSENPEINPITIKPGLPWWLSW